MIRFTIRELVMLTVIVGLALGWAVDHERQRVNAQLGQETIPWRKEIARWVVRARILSKAIEDEDRRHVLYDSEGSGFTIRYPDGTLVHHTIKGHRTLPEKD